MLWCPGLMFSPFLLNRFGDQEIILAEIGLQKYFTENIKAIWASSFKVQAKIERKCEVRHTDNYCQCVSLRRRACFGRTICFSKCISVWLFIVET